MAFFSDPQHAIPRLVAPAGHAKNTCKTRLRRVSVHAFGVLHNPTRSMCSTPSTPPVEWYIFATIKARH